MTVTLLKLNTIIDEALVHARAEGTIDGTNAGAWVFDGNTPTETYARVRAGLDDGDPAVLNDLPRCDLSMQCRDGTSATDVASDALDSAGHSRDLIEDAFGDRTWPTVRDELADAYEAAYNTAVQDEIARICNYQLQEEENA